MSQSRAKAARRNGTPDDSVPQVEVEDPAPGPSEEGPAISHPCVIVMRVALPDGQIEVQFAEANGIDPLAVPSLLRKAALLKEQQLGL